MSMTARTLSLSLFSWLVLSLHAGRAQELVLWNNCSDATALVDAAAHLASGSRAPLLMRTGSRYEREFLAELCSPRELGVLAEAGSLVRTAPRVVVCPAAPRSQLLQAACLAGIMQLPLLIASGNSELHQHVGQLEKWGTREIIAVGAAGNLTFPGRSIVARVRDESAAQEEYLAHALKKGPIEAFVVANPHDGRDGKVSMSTLAPWLAVQKHGLLLLTNAAGTNVSDLLARATRRPELKSVDTLLLVGDKKSLPPEKRPNPLAGKDEFIEVEPGTPRGNEAITYATGRLFHDNPAFVALMLARAHLWSRTKPVPPKALLVSNPGERLHLLETLSRTSVQELHNAGFDVTAFIGREAERPEVRAVLPQQTIFLWEGHQSTLFRDYEAHLWSEPLKPSLVFLQSCLALEESKALPFLTRGAVAVLGASSRTYSGSGGALALSFFDGLVHEKQTVGAALRHAKNFLVCFAHFKEQRLGEESKLGGANLRTAWGFSLWGDPTLRVPLPAPPPHALPGVRHSLNGNKLTIHLPAAAFARVSTERYQSQVLPNQRLGGYFTRTEDKNPTLVPLVFREIAFPDAGDERRPFLKSRVPQQNWVFLYDQRRRVGYLLVRPRPSDTSEIRFTVEWDSRQGPEVRDRWSALSTEY